MNSDSNRFVNNLNDVPPIPESILAGVHKAVRRKKLVVGLVWSVAIAFVLGSSAIITLPTGKEVPVAAIGERTGAYEEIQDAVDFLDGTGLDDDIDMYAFVDPTVF